MKGGSGRVVRSLAAAVACLLGIALAVGQAAPQGGGQAAAQEKPLMSEQYFKNVQLLRGIPVDEFLDTMGMFAAATGMNCVDCHVAESDGNWPKYDPNYQKCKPYLVTVPKNEGYKEEVSGGRTAERVEPEYGVGPGQQRHAGDGGSWNQVPIHGISERLVDAHAVHEYRHSGGGPEYG